VWRAAGRDLGAARRAGRKEGWCGGAGARRSWWRGCVGRRVGPAVGRVGVEIDGRGASGMEGLRGGPVARRSGIASRWWASRGKFFPFLIIF